MSMDVLKSTTVRTFFVVFPSFLFCVLFSATCNMGQPQQEQSLQKLDLPRTDTIKPIVLTYEGTRPWNFYYIPDIISGVPVNLVQSMRFTIRSEKPVYFMESSFLQIPFILFPGDSLVIETKDDLPVMKSKDRIRTNELQFFVALCKKFGAVRPLMKTTYITKPVTITVRDSIIEHRYAERLNFLESYSYQYKVSDTFLGITKKILFYSRLNEKLNLYYPGFNHNKIVAFYKDSLSNYRKAFKDDSSFLYNTIYQTALLTLIRQSQKRFKTPGLPFLSYSDITTPEIYDLIQKGNLFPEPLRSFIKAELTTKILRREIAQGKDTIELSTLLHQIENDKYKMKLLEMVHKMTGIPQTNNFSDQLLYSLSQNKVIAFSVLLEKNKGNFVLIDLWATWCAPCVASLPESKKLAKRFKNNLSVVFVSLDEDSLQWRDFSTGNLTHQDSYLMRSAFNSAFARHFSINAIPRYMLFGRSGELLDPNCLPPGNNLLIEKLQKLIKEK